MYVYIAWKRILNGILRKFSFEVKKIVETHSIECSRDQKSESAYCKLSWNCATVSYLFHPVLYHIQWIINILLLHSYFELSVSWFLFSLCAWYFVMIILWDAFTRYVVYFIHSSAICYMLNKNWFKMRFSNLLKIIGQKWFQPNIL